VVLTIVANLNLEMLQADAITAYLNGKLEEEIYMEQPEGFINPLTDHLVCLLKKALYGLKQSGHQWLLLLCQILIKLGFVPSDADDCLYI
jgi:hypothetical protein